MQMDERDFEICDFFTIFVHFKQYKHTMFFDTKSTIVSLTGFDGYNVIAPDVNSCMLLFVFRLCHFESTLIQWFPILFLPAKGQLVTPPRNIHTG